jgi:CRP-like cAMP-binding protein
MSPSTTETSYRAPIISRVPLFEGCSPKEVERVARYTSEESHPAGAVVVEEGKAGEDFYVIVDGQVEIVQRGEVVNTLGPGQFFGEVALIGHAQRNATVRAATPVRLLALPARSFRSLIGRYPAIFEQVVDVLEVRA